jgi:hypothetical protein
MTDITSKPDLETLRDDLRMGRHRKAFSSLRAMRRLLERTTVECYEGLRPMKDMAAVAVAVKAMAEIFVAEKTLVAAGLDMEESSQHPLGHDGGMPELAPRNYRSVTKSYKKGTGARGTPVSEFKVVEEGESVGTPLDQITDQMEEQF